MILALLLALQTSALAAQSNRDQVERLSDQHRTIVEEMRRLESQHQQAQKELAPALKSLVTSVDALNASIKAQAEAQETLLRVAQKAEPLIDDAGAFLAALPWVAYMLFGGTGFWTLKQGVGVARETPLGSRWLPDRRRDPATRTRVTDSGGNG